MKSALIFIVCIIVGFALVYSYFFLMYQQNILIAPQSIITTKFSLADAPSDSLKGKIASISGTVNWLSRIAKKPVRLTTAQMIQQGEELETGNKSEVAVTIQNASAVILSANSHINFIQLLPVNLVIAQDKGLVTYQNSGENAMSVNTLDLITAVNRGWADIAVDKNAGTVTVSVMKGAVTEGYEDTQNVSNVVTVNAGQKFIFDDTTRTNMVE